MLAGAAALATAGGMLACQPALATTGGHPAGTISQARPLYVQLPTKANGRLTITPQVVNQEINNANSKKCAEVAGWGTDNGDNVDQWTCFGDANQEWNFHLYTTLGTTVVVWITNVHSGKCLEVAGWGTGNGANVDQWECLKTPNGEPDGNQLWDLIPTTGGAYQYLNFHSSKVMEVVGEGKSNGDNVDQWEWNGGAHQQWTG